MVALNREDGQDLQQIEIECQNLQRQRGKGPPQKIESLFAKKNMEVGTISQNLSRG
jgi:hypothetical protein